MAKVEELQQLIAAAERMVAFTGAGISTESGIPDYRSPGGIWTKFKPIEFGDFIGSAEARRETWRHKFASHEVIERATPNAGHRALARLVDVGRFEQHVVARAGDAADLVLAVGVGEKHRCRAALREAMRMRAPASPSASAICNPSPRDPPVTSAVLPVRLNRERTGVDMGVPLGCTLLDRTMRPQSEL